MDGWILHGANARYVMGNRSPYRRREGLCSLRRRGWFLAVLGLSGSKISLGGFPKLGEIEKSCKSRACVVVA